jgi:hypothetical protein
MVKTIRTIGTKKTIGRIVIRSGLYNFPKIIGFHLYDRK